MANWGSNFAYGNSCYKDEGCVPVVDGYFYFLPNWKYPVRMKYKFNTIISTTRRKYEQRKALSSKPKRIQSFTVTDNEEHTLIKNYLIYLKSTDLALPIYEEPCLPTVDGLLLGLNAVPVNDISNYFNLQNYTDSVLIIDRRDIVNAEAHLLDSVDGDTINLVIPVAGNFLGAYTVIFPLFNCFLTSHSFDDVTDTMTKFELEFTEKF